MRDSVTLPDFLAAAAESSRLAKALAWAKRRGSEDRLELEGRLLAARNRQYRLFMRLGAEDRKAARAAYA